MLLNRNKVVPVAIAFDPRQVVPTKGGFIMSQLTGLGVTLLTATDNDEAETDDNVYIGAFGTGGGREFPFASQLKPGQKKYAFGSIWEGGFIDGNTSFPARSKPGEDNDPALVPLEVEQVNFVYIRKIGDPDSDDDNAYRLQEVTVALYGPAQPTKRVFKFEIPNKKSVWMGNEHGRVIYLKEQRVAPRDLA
jgi:hypothetical protein